jgi:hypothetical protein
VGGAIPERVREFQYHPPGAIDRQTLEGNRRARTVTGEAFELVALNRGARDRSIEREALKIRGERLRCGGSSQ